MRPPVRVCRIGRIMATLYSSIKDDLLAKIKDGTYKEGDIIPPEVELAKSYGVSRPTIRQALQILANDGYIGASWRASFLKKIRPRCYHR